MNIQVGDLVEFVSDPGWKGIRGHVLDIDQYNCVSIKPLEGSRYHHTGELVKDKHPSYMDHAGGWDVSAFRKVEETIKPEFHPDTLEILRALLTYSEPKGLMGQIAREAAERVLRGE